ncbi:MAG TPA: hypothetical protein VH701_05730 [Vicinamibacterales bacterium]|jgi:hypothetical protein
MKALQILIALRDRSIVNHVGDIPNRFDHPGDIAGGDAQRSIKSAEKGVHPSLYGRSHAQTTAIVVLF